MARHSSFKVLIAHETYQNFFATVRARELAEQWAAQQSPGFAGQDLTFLSANALSDNQPKSESWIESWLAGKVNGPTL
jgi:hypothetical protein